jgi:hypothetical protein
MSSSEQQNAELSVYALRAIVDGLELPSERALQSMREEIERRSPGAAFVNDAQGLARTVLQLRGKWQS